MRPAIATLALVLSGCVTAAPTAYPVAVPVACVPSGLPAGPMLDVTPQQMSTAEGPAERMALAYRFWTAVQPWLAPAEAALAGCRAAGSPAAPP